jgi:hypothetical protein
MKRWLIFYTFKIWILPNLIKYTCWLSPLEQHHKLKKKKHCITFKNGLYCEHYPLKYICKFTCKYSCQFHEDTFLVRNDQLDFFFCIFRTLNTLNFALYLLKCTGPSTFWKVSFQTRSFIFYLSTICSVF